MINPMKVLKLKNAWSTFTNNHPKFPMFLNAVYQKGIEEGTVIEITVTSKDGKQMNTNMKLTKTDMELFQTLSEMAKD